MKLTHIAAGLVLAIAAGSSSAATLEEATAAVESAKKSGYYWLFTDKLLENAKQAQANNDTANMSKFIDEVMVQTAGSMAQAEAAKKAGPMF